MRLINPIVIIRILGTILAIETICFIACVPVALIYNEPLMPFLWSALIPGIFALIIWFFTRQASYERISTRDGYITVTLSWIVFTVIGAIPYIISNTIPHAVDAIFESVSGFTTTGASILADVEILPKSILFWRSLTHWIGGLGIIVLFIVILPSLKAVSYQIFSLESSLKEKIHPRTKSIGYRILIIYSGLTFFEVVLLTIGDMNLFDAICHTFGTVATGGFSTKNSSIGLYSPYSQYVVLIFMFLSGISFVVFYHAVKLNFRKIKSNDELWFYFGTMFLSGALVTALLFVKTDRTFEVAFRDGFFQVASILTTTGYATSDYLYWPIPPIIILFLLLFAGASTGSTTGSIKMGRHLIVLKTIRNAFVKLLHPNAIYQIRYNAHVLTWNTNNSIISFVLLYLFIFIISSLIFSLSGTDVLTSSSVVASALGNVGPAMGQIGPYQNYGHLSDFNKLFLSFLMIIGRLEILTFIILFTKTFWRK